MTLKYSVSKSENKSAQSDIPQFDGNISLNSSVCESENIIRTNQMSKTSVSPRPATYTDGDMSLEPIDISNSERDDREYSIPVMISAQRQSKVCEFRGKSANIVINHRSRKVMTANQMPVVVNLNPRSIYNKKEEFRTMMEQLNVDICFMSESWDRERNGLENVIGMADYKIIKNVVQRQGKGGKPALIIK